MIGRYVDGSSHVVKWGRGGGGGGDYLTWFNCINKLQSYNCHLRTTVICVVLMKKIKEIWGAGSQLILLITFMCQL